MKAVGCGARGFRESSAGGTGKIGARRGRIPNGCRRIESMGGYDGDELRARAEEGWRVRARRWRKYEREAAVFAEEQLSDNVGVRTTFRVRTTVRIRTMVRVKDCWGY